LRHRSKDGAKERIKIMDSRVQTEPREIVLLKPCLQAMPVERKAE
jgi:hypothetical protein